MAFDPVQGLLALGSRDGVVKVCGSPVVERTFYGRPEGVTALDFLPGQSRLLVVYQDSVDVVDLRRQALVGEREFGQRITCVEVAPSPSKFAYVGTATGNVFLLNIAEEEALYTSTYAISYAACGGKPSPGSGYHAKIDQLRMKQRRESSMGAPSRASAYRNRVAAMSSVPTCIPDSVMAVHTNPDDEQFILVAFHGGLLVQWHLLKKAVHRTFGPAVSGLTTARWHPDGQRIAAAYSSGRLALWGRRTPDKPERLFFPDDLPAAARRPVSRLRWTQAADGTDLLFCLGGGPADQPNGLYLHRQPPDGRAADSLFLGAGLPSSLLAEPSSLVDFALVLPSPWPSASSPSAVLLLAADARLLAHSLRSPSCPPLPLPPPLLFQHSRDVAVLRYYRGGVHEEALNGLIRDVYQLYHTDVQFDLASWPLSGGSIPKRADGEPSFDLLLTGHCDGAVRFWAVSPTHIVLVGAFSAPSGITDLHLSPASRTLALTCADGSLRIYKFTISDALKQPLLRPPNPAATPSKRSDSPSSSSTSSSLASLTSTPTLSSDSSDSPSISSSSFAELIPRPDSPATPSSSQDLTPADHQQQQSQPSSSSSSSSSSSGGGGHGSIQVEFDPAKGWYAILVFQYFLAKPSALVVAGEWVGVGDVGGHVYLFSTETSSPPLFFDIGAPVTIDRIRLVRMAEVPELAVYIGASNGRVYWATIGGAQCRLLICPGARNVDFRSGEEAVHNLLLPVDLYGGPPSRSSPAAFLVQCLEYELNIIAVPQHKRVAHIEFPDSRVAFAALLPVKSTTSPLPSHAVITFTANGDLHVYSLFQLERVFSCPDALAEFGLTPAQCTDARVLARTLAFTGDGVFLAFTPDYELVRSSLFEVFENTAPTLHDPARLLGDKPSRGIMKSLFGAFTAVNHEEIFGQDQYKMVHEGAASSHGGAPAAASSSLSHDQKGQVDSALAGPRAARNQVSGLTRDLERTKLALDERGKQLSKLEEQSAELRNAGEQFRENARALRKKQESSWFW